jgi:hypothetical protein
VKNVTNTLCTFLCTSFCTLGPEQLSVIQKDLRKPQEKIRRGKNTKSGGTNNRAGCFFPRRSKKFGNIPERTKVMPLIKKAPAIVTLEVQVEEPVKQLLEDYARFIESSPDHVVNSVIKRNLWRDPDYRKWREQRRAQSPDSPTSVASPRG